MDRVLNFWSLFPSFSNNSTLTSTTIPFLLSLSHLLLPFYVLYRNSVNVVVVFGDIRFSFWGSFAELRLGLERRR
jgi:hypothetical protein